MRKVAEMILSTSMPMSRAASLSWDTARIALPRAERWMSRVSPIMRTAATARSMTT